MWPFKHRNLGISRLNHSEPIDYSTIKTRVASELAEKQIEGLQKAANGRKGATRHLTVSLDYRRIVIESAQDSPCRWEICIKQCSEDNRSLICPELGFKTEELTRKIVNYVDYVCSDDPTSLSEKGLDFVVGCRWVEIRDCAPCRCISEAELESWQEDRDPIDFGQYNTVAKDRYPYAGDAEPFGFDVSVSFEYSAIEKARHRKKEEEARREKARLAKEAAEKKKREEKEARGKRQEEALREHEEWLSAFNQRWDLGAERAMFGMECDAAKLDEKKLQEDACELIEGILEQYGLLVSKIKQDRTGRSMLISASNSEGRHLHIRISSPDLKLSDVRWQNAAAGMTYAFALNECNAQNVAASLANEGFDDIAVQQTSLRTLMCSAFMGSARYFLRVTYDSAAEKSNCDNGCNNERQHEIDFDAMTGYEFERFCAALLEKNGYDDVEVTQGSGDQGIDVIAWRDGVKYGIQCKCYSSVVGNKAVQEAFAGKAFYECHVAVILTNSYFTRAAAELAKSNNVVLWDGDKLREMMTNL